MTADRPLRVVMLSKACYVAAYRRKLEILGSFPDIDLTLVVPPYWRFGERKEALEPGFDIGYRTIVQNPVLNGNHHLHFYPRFGRLVRDLQPDLVHIDEEPYDFVTWHALRTAHRAGARTLFFTWQNLELDLPAPFRLLQNAVLDQADGAIAGNQEGAEILRRQAFRKPLEVIPQFGVDEALFRPDPDKSRPGTRFRIGYLGRLVEEKGVLDLLRACATLDGWELTIAGQGPLRDRLLADAARLGVRDRVTMLGGVRSIDIPDVLRGLDCLVLPSRTTPRWKEQFGRVLVEAMASGVPVIGSDSGEIPNVIGTAGLVVPEANSEALQGALGRLMSDAELWQRLSLAGRERVLGHFTHQIVAGRTRDLYLRICRQS